MTDSFVKAACEPGSKAKWVKPAVRQLKAGAAEFNNGNVDDGDPGASQNES